MQRCFCRNVMFVIWLWTVQICDASTRLACKECNTFCKLLFLKKPSLQCSRCKTRVIWPQCFSRSSGWAARWFLIYGTRTRTVFTSSCKTLFANCQCAIESLRKFHCQKSSDFSVHCQPLMLYCMVQDYIEKMAVGCTVFIKFCSCYAANALINPKVDSKLELEWCQTGITVGYMSSTWVSSELCRSAVHEER